MKKNLLTVFVGVLLLALNANAANLTLWEHEHDEDQKLLDSLIQEFQKANPGVTIQRSHYQTEDLRTQFQTAAMGGGGADLVLAPNDFAGPFSIMGIIQPVNGFTDMKKFFPDTVEAVSDSADKIWGIPVTNGNHLLLFVNQKMVAKVPTTIEELIEEAKKVTKPEERRFGFAYNLNEPFWFVTFLGAYGETPLVNAKPTLNSDGMVQALQLVKSLKFDDKIVPSDCDYACADTLFVEGNVAMIINGDWAISRYMEHLKENLVVAPLPQLKATGKHMAPMTSGKYLFFNRKLSGAKLAAAKKFSEFLTSQPVQERLIKDSQKLPALLNAAESDTMKNHPKLVDSLNALEHGQPMPMDIEMRAVWDAIRPQLQRVMSGRAEPKAAAQAMQRFAETKIREMKE